jgi:hypothetical protein
VIRIASLGSWVDEKRSQLRDLMRIADTLSIDILNAHGGIGVSIPMPRLFEGCQLQMSFKLIVVLAACVAVSHAVVSGDYHSVGVQTDQTLRGALNTLSSYSKAVNTAHSQSFVSRTDYTNNPGLIAHAPIVAHAPVVAAPAYHAPLAYHAPVATAYHAPIATAYHGAALPYAYGGYKASLAAAAYYH